jgi:hypothetical protein
VNVYTQGSIVVSEVVFRDKQNNSIAVDPEVVDFYYLLGNPLAPDFTSETLTWESGIIIPAIGVIARLGVGRYVTWIDTSGAAGVCTPVWPSEGEYQAVGWNPFQINLIGQPA